MSDQEKWEAQDQTTFDTYGYLMPGSPKCCFAWKAAVSAGLAFSAQGRTELEFPVRIASRTARLGSGLLVSVWGRWVCGSDRPE